MATRKTTNTEDAAEQRHEAEVEEAKAALAAGIKPLKAVYLIDGGDEFGGATPGSFFIPKTEQERAELLKIEAAVELTEAEDALAAATGVRPLGLTPGEFANIADI